MEFLKPADSDEQGLDDLQIEANPKGRKDIRLASDEEKDEAYNQIHSLYLQEKSVRLKEHKSGFPAVTVDCGEVHILTDVLSLERWWAKKRKEGGE